MRGVTTVEIHGELFVVLPQAEYKRLVAIGNKAHMGSEVPQLPPADKHGNRPARETLQVVLARKLIERRQQLGLTQQQLAELSKVRAETISRLESGKHAPNAATVDKLENAMDKFAAQMANKPNSKAVKARTVKDG